MRGAGGGDPLRRELPCLGMDGTAVRGGDAHLGTPGADPAEIRRASARLPERQRVALDLLERKQLSYEQIATSLEAVPGSVAQLISRARINLYDELWGTLLASVAAPSPECERALPLIAAREDGQLEAVPDGDAAWLDAHLAGCERCRPAVEQMGEAAASYRAWAQSESPAESSAKSPSAARGEGAVEPKRRRLTLVAASAAALLILGIAAAFAASGGDGPPSANPAADARATVGSSDAEPTGGERVRAGGKEKAGRNGNEKRKAKHANGDLNGSAGQPAAAAAPVTAVVPSPAPQNDGALSEPVSGPSRPSGKAGVDAPRQTSTPKTVAKPQPAPTSAQASEPGPTTTEAPPAEAPPPAEEAPKAPGRSGEAPGKPTGRPSR
jgi:hypothetical protein